MTSDPAPLVERGADFRPAIYRAMDAVPEGGFLLEAGWLGRESLSGWLERERSDRMLSLFADGLASVRARPDSLPFQPKTFFGVVAPHLLPQTPDPVDRNNALAEMARIANRYLVLGSLHPVSLTMRRNFAGATALPHRRVEVEVAAHGFRPLSRAATSAFFRPEWAYVFVRN